jgi:hypothetical protein
MPLTSQYVNNVLQPIRASDIAKEFSNKNEAFVHTIFNNSSTIRDIHCNGTHYACVDGSSVVTFVDDKGTVHGTLDTFLYDTINPPGLTLITQDKNGFYIAANHEAIFRYNSNSGYWELVAGVRGLPYPGGHKDGTASQAQFKYINGLAVNLVTNDIYVSELNNRTIRKISNGIVSTVAGSPGATRTVSDGVYSNFSDPAGIAFLDHSKNQLLVIDGGAAGIKIVIPPSTGSALISSVAGSYTSSSITDGSLTTCRFNFGLFTVQKLVSDPNKNWYVPNKTAIRQLVFNGADALVRTFAGSKDTTQTGRVDGDATLARFNYPTSIAVDPVKNSNGSYNIVVADDSFLRKVYPYEPPGMPSRFSRYYRDPNNANRVKNTTINAVVPVSGVLRFSNFYGTSDFVIKIKFLQLNSETFSQTLDSYGYVTASGTKNDGQVVFSVSGTSSSYQIRSHKTDKTGYLEQTVLNNASATLGSLDSTTTYEFLIIDTATTRCFKFFLSVGYDTSPTIVSRLGTNLVLNQDYVLGFNNADLNAIPTGTNW